MPIHLHSDFLHERHVRPRPSDLVPLLHVEVGRLLCLDAIATVIPHQGVLTRTLEVHDGAIKGRTVGVAGTLTLRHLGKVLWSICNKKMDISWKSENEKGN